MKIIVTFITLLCFSSAWAGNEKRLRLIFNLIDSRDTSETFMGRIEINLYRASDSQHVLKIDNFFLGQFVADSFPAGTYIMSYTNIIRQEQQRIIAIPPLDSFNIQIAIDSLQCYQASDIDKLRKGEQLEISFKSHGCFHHYDRHIVIERKKGQLRASIYRTNNKPLIRLSQRLSGKLLRREILTDEKKVAYIRFENELVLLDTSNDGCTTKDNYKIRSPYLNLSKLDAGCNWHGYQFLHRSLFPQPK